MSHVREGEIHAYLDGALDRLGEERATEVRTHVARCEDCRGRLEEERRLRDAADQLLDLGAPASIAMPPFEEIRRRAQADASTAAPEGPDRRQRRALPDLQRWAWAASLVLALGTGWLLRGTDLARVASSTEYQARAPGLAERPDVDPTDLDMLRPGATESNEQALASAAEVREAPAAQGAVASEPGARAAPENLPPVSRILAEEEAVGRVAATEMAENRLNVATPDSAQARAEAAIDLLQRRATAVEVAARAAPAQTMAAPAAVLRDALSNAPTIEADDEAAGALASDLLAPGLEVVEISGDSAAVRVVQRFPEGDTLVLEFIGVPGALAMLERTRGAGLEARADRQAPSAPADLRRAREVEASADRPAARSGDERPLSEVRVSIDGGLLILRSHRPQEELEELARSWERR